MDPMEQAVLAEIKILIQTGEGVDKATAADFRRLRGMSECQRCGQCCQQVPCLVSVAYFGELDECPWLSFEGGQASCRFITDRLGTAGEDVARATVDFEMGCGKRRRR